MKLRPALWLAALAAHVAAQPSVMLLTDGGTVEFEQTLDDPLLPYGWRWFVLPTNELGAVTAGLVLQRGYSQNFPRMGLVIMASSSSVPPGSLTSCAGTPITCYDPTRYAEHDDQAGPRRRFLWDSPIDGVRQDRDWRVLTLGFDTDHDTYMPQDVQVPLGNVLIGKRALAFCAQASSPGDPARRARRAPLSPCSFTGRTL